MPAQPLSLSPKLNVGVRALTHVILSRHLSPEHRGKSLSLLVFFLLA